MNVDDDDKTLADRLNALFMPPRPPPILKWSSQSALQDALNTSLPTPPAPAKLPPSFRASRRIIHPPPFLDNLTRSTLPTASLSPPLPVERPQPTRPSLELVKTPPIVLLQANPTRRSVDSLRAFTRTFTSDSISVTNDLQRQDTVQTSSSSTSKWWFQNDSKFFGTKEDVAPPSQKKKYLSPRNPVVFCHGLLGFDSVTIGPAIAPLEVAHWRGIKEVLEENGTEVLITRVPATSSPVDRAKVLEEKISSVYPGRSVHLIGHSMGGLDCRYLTTHLTHRKFTVLSITTIATPHRGSSFADHFLSTVGRARMPSVLSLLDLLPNGGGDGKAFECLTVESMKKFNEETPDVPGVRYFSWGAVYEPGLIDTWKWPHSVILEKEGPNDGLVSVESSKWGTYLGTLSQVNHLDLVGWVNTARYKWAEMMGKEIDFRPATFYLGIADMLAHEVEGQVDETRASEEGEDGTKNVNHGTRVGEGVELEEEGGAEHASRSAAKGKGKEKAQETTRSDSERLRMVDNHDKTGLNGYENGGDTPTSQSLASNQVLKANLRKSDSKSGFLSFFTPNTPPLRSISLPPSNNSSTTNLSSSADTKK
ncbi:alpha/beta-hydrolase [Agrocybe pediades]|nr:alpha/beta-hydrolase [Agrocybe pediades]